MICHLFPVTRPLLQLSHLIVFGFAALRDGERVGVRWKFLGFVRSYEGAEGTGARGRLRCCFLGFFFELVWGFDGSVSALSVYRRLARFFFRWIDGSHWAAV